MKPTVCGKGCEAAIPGRMPVFWVLWDVLGLTGG